MFHTNNFRVRPVRKGRICFWLTIVAAMLTAFSPDFSWANTSASGLRVAEHPDGITRLVIDLSHSINFTTRLADNPYRIIIDTDSLGWSSPPSLPRTTGPILGLSYGEDNPGGHLTLRLGRPADVKAAFLMSPRDGAGWRFVIDIKDTTKQEFVAQAHPSNNAHLSAPLPPPPVPQAKPSEAETPPPPPPPVAATSPTIIITSPAVSAQAQATPEPAPVVTQTARGPSPVLSAPMPPPIPLPPAQQPAPTEAVTVKAPPPAPETAPPEKAAPEKAAMPMAEKPHPDKDRKHDKDTRQVIVIDPGHGGVDPGATGVSGIYEKYITYSMARELQQQLEKTGHYLVHLTRDRDVFIPLRERTAIARQLNADLFISLHADVVKDTDIRGLSVYTLSQNASDAEAQSLADKENKADLIAGIDLSHESTDVTNILIDLAQRETMNRSAGFASEIVGELGHETPLLANTHRFAGFAVLKSPDIPAVLIEMGYLSNPTDEKNLRQPEYRAKLAHAISRAVDHYFLQGQKAKRP